MTRILLADDHAVVRKGLKQILQESMPTATFGEAANGEEAIRKSRIDVWDIVILDISLPGKSGLDVLKDLRQAQPRLPVLVLSMHPEAQFAVRFLKAGAAGYLTKRMATRNLVAAVKKVLRGGRYISPSLAGLLAEALRALADRAPHEALSDREYQVFRLLSTGKTVKKIGQELSLSPQTVSTHRAHILEKMAMKTNADLIQYAIQNGLLN